MDPDKKRYLLEEVGKYCLDISKLVFAGVILAGIMKNDIEDYFLLFTLSGIVFIGLLAAGFNLISRSKNRKV